LNGSILQFNDHVRDLGVYHDSRLKYDHHVSLIAHKAYKRMVLILKCFHSRNFEVLKFAFCVFVRPLLEFASQVWSPHYKYLIDKVESVQRFFTRTISGIRDLPYADRLKNLGLETIERRRLVHDLVFIYKILHGLRDVSLSITFAKSSTRGNILKLVKPGCRCDIRKYFLVAELSTFGILFLILL